MIRRLFLIMCLPACSTSAPSRVDAAAVNPPPVVAPPTISCTLPDAGCDGASCDAGPAYPNYNPCQLPPSVCADDYWAAYFDDGTCVNGTCELVTKYHYCEAGCSYGACISNQSTAPSRGF